MRYEEKQIVAFLAVFCATHSLTEANVTFLHSHNGSEFYTNQITQPNVQVHKDFEGYLRNGINGLITHMIPSAMKLIGNEHLSSECRSALVRTAFSLRQEEVWALKLVFSSGGIPNNVFEGSTASLGSYEQCVRTQAPNDGTHRSFEGQYCSIYLSLSPMVQERLTERLNAAGQLQGRRNPASWNKNPRAHFSGYRTGICVPSSCLEEELDYVIQTALGEYGTNATVRNCVTTNMSSLTYFHIFIFSFIAASISTVALGTCLELYDTDVEFEYPNRKNLALLVRTLLCFSCIRNFRKLMNRREEPGTINDKLRFVHGVRVAMILWVMLGGAYFYAQVDTFLYHDTQVVAFVTDLHSFGETCKERSCREVV